MLPPGAAPGSSWSRSAPQALEGELVLQVILV